MKKKKNGIERIKSGIKGFDKLIEGGFVKGSVNLLLGGSGSGKTIFSLQFLLQGLKNNENCAYIALDEKKETILKNAKAFGWNLEEFEKKKKLFFLEYSPEGIKRTIDEGGGELEELITRKKIKRIVIDSLTTFELMLKTSLERAEETRALLEILKSWDCTALITLQRNISVKEMKEDLSVEFETDSIIILYFIRKGLQRERFLEILKMKNTNHSKKLHRFEITNEGISIKK